MQNVVKNRSTLSLCSCLIRKIGGEDIFCLLCSLIRQTEILRERERERKKERKIKKDNDKEKGRKEKEKRRYKNKEKFERNSNDTMRSV